MKIGELAKLTKCSVETIRYYEKKGLLSPSLRSESNYRLYTHEHIERLTLARHCRSLDMTLDEIRILLKFCDAPEQNCGQVNTLLDEHIVHVSARIAELKKLEVQLKHLRARCNEERPAKKCGILNELIDEAATFSKENRISTISASVHLRGLHTARK